MNCQQARLFIEPYADGELDAAAILELEKHIHDCPACALELKNARALKKVLKQDSLFSTAPKELRRQIKMDLRAESKIKSRRQFWNWNWLTAATSSAVFACLAILLTITLTRPSAQQNLAQEIVSSHVRSLMANHLMDVASTDQHTVKPWFNGKLDFSPPVKDLAAQQFPLIGGRLDYLGGHSAAVLIFQRNKHVINLFVWPAKENDAQPAVLSAIHGYHLIHWTESQMTFWAVSDLNEKELEEFAQIFASN
jgi:anti-sigma factor RsiW